MNKLQTIMLLLGLSPHLLAAVRASMRDRNLPPPTFKETNLLRHIPQAELPTEGCDLYRAYRYNTDILFIVCAQNPANVLYVPHQNPE